MRTRYHTANHRAFKVQVGRVDEGRVSQRSRERLSAAQRRTLIPSRVWRYSPQRAIMALGLALMAVATASGLLGVGSAATAETSATTVASRYLMLQPPVRDLRTSIADEQLVLEASFSGASVTPALLARAATDSTASEQSYLAVHRLLLATGEAALAPGLDTKLATYEKSQSGISAFLTGEAPQNTQAATTERNAYSALDGALQALQATVTTRLTSANDQAWASAHRARRNLLWCLALGLPFGLAVTALLARKAGQVASEAARRDADQAVVTRRNEFEGRLQRALEMARAEAPAFEMVALGLAEAAPRLRSELLLADSSRAHFRRVLANPSDNDEAGCGVVAPGDCPAASSGQTRIYPVSTALDTCPNLKGRGCSALCVPVSIGGNSVGVVHVMGTDGSPPDELVKSDVEVVARRASERFAMLRAFELSQTQANTDSLTGLLTRRSLESRIQGFSDGGLPYSVAYGDLDHFKRLNDTFGHNAGDRALRAFSQVLRDALRPSDVACRYGGEEFVVVLPACLVVEAVAVLERVRELLADRLTSGHLPLFTVSFGLASSHQADTFENVVALADEALMGAKAAGRDQIVVARSSVVAPAPALTVVESQSAAQVLSGTL